MTNFFVFILSDTLKLRNLWIFFNILTNRIDILHFNPNHIVAFFLLLFFVANLFLKRKPCKMPNEAYNIFWRKYKIQYHSQFILRNMRHWDRIWNKISTWDKRKSRFMLINVKNMACYRNEILEAKRKLEYDWRIMAYDLWM